MAASNYASGDRKLHRKALVTRMRCRGLTMHEISERMAIEFGEVAPSGLPWSDQVIASDLRELAEEWKQEALGDMAAHKGRIFAEIQEIKRTAWQQGNLSLVLAAIAQERKVLGVDEPLTTTLTLELGDGLRDKLEALAERYQTIDIAPSGLPSPGQPQLEGEVITQDTLDDLRRVLGKKPCAGL